MSEFDDVTVLDVFGDDNQRTLGYKDKLTQTLRLGLTDIDTTSLPGFQKKHVGKVRDIYECDDHLILVTTDRQSAFDRQLCEVPCKGQILNLTSLWWFQQTAHIVKNHVIASPHPNVIVARKCTVFPVEFVMRGYITGLTSTSLWVNYSAGMRTYCGHCFPHGLIKNQKLDENKLTPTTKSAEHDELISAEEIIRTGLMTQEDWDTCAQHAHALFSHGQLTAASKGLILVDTKYEFGKDMKTGEILLIDEIQTPDSSRYWIAATYEDSMSKGAEPANIDKECLRRWYRARCDPYQALELPPAPEALIAEVARRYILIYELLTGQLFDVTSSGVDQDSTRSLNDRVVAYFNSK